LLLECQAPVSMDSHRDKDPKSHPSRTAAKQHAVAPQSDSRPSANRGGTDEVMCVRLTRKFADMIDGVDLSRAHVGDRLDVSPHDAQVLIAEGWAERAPKREASRRDVRSVAPDKAHRRRHTPKKKS